MKLTSYYIDPAGRKWRITSLGTFWPMEAPPEHFRTYAFGNEAACANCYQPWPCDATLGVSL